MRFAACSRLLGLVVICAKKIFWRITHMKTVILGLALAAAFTAPAFAALKVGDMAPDFSATASLGGKEFNFKLADALKKGPTVVYFYPSAYTGGCDLEAHTFAESRDKFTAVGASIIGVSGDNME